MLKCGLVFERSYFQNSPYSNYLCYDNRTYDELARVLTVECGFEKSDVIVDYGCATGSLLFSLKKAGFKRLLGTDISFWAIEYGKTKFGLKDELQYYNCNLLSVPKDWLVLLDVLEHIPSVEELRLICGLIGKSDIRKGIVLRVPVSLGEGQDLFLEVSRRDQTHFQVHAKKWWVDLFESVGFFPRKRFCNTPVIWDSDGVLAVLLGREAAT